MGSAFSAAMHDPSTSVSARLIRSLGSRQLPRLPGLQIVPSPAPSVTG